MFFSISGRLDLGMITLSPLNSTTVVSDFIAIVPIRFSTGSITALFDGQPFFTVVMISVSVPSSSVFFLIKSSFVSGIGSMCKTLMLYCLYSNSFAFSVNEALDNVSAMRSCFPSLYSTVIEYF